jgi:hypothetical protein
MPRAQPGLAVLLEVPGVVAGEQRELFDLYQLEHGRRDWPVWLLRQNGWVLWQFGWLRCNQ